MDNVQLFSFSLLNTIVEDLHKNRFLPEVLKTVGIVTALYVGYWILQTDWTLVESIIKSGISPWKTGDSRTGASVSDPNPKPKGEVVT